MRRSIVLALAFTLPLLSRAQELTLPLGPDSCRFAVIGDSGTGDRAQYLVADRMAEYHAKFPFEFVLMLGDNLYGGQSARDFERKFERPYKALLDAGVKFYASLGNHDNPNQRFYKPFNMDGREYYTFTAPKESVRFFALNSNYLDPEQMKWIERELRNAGERWKICFFHHPMYSSGARHGPNVVVREALEPLFVKYGVDVVFAGHEHFYERLKPQNGIQYFISGGAAKLRRGNIRTRSLTVKGFDQGYHFMLVEIVRDELSFQVISQTGQTVDSGVVPRSEAITNGPSSPPQASQLFLPLFSSFARLGALP